MMATPEGAAYFLEGVIHSPFFSPLRRAFQAKTLTFWSGNGGASGVTPSLEALLSIVLPILGPWGAYPIHLVQASWRLPLSPDLLILSSLHLHHHFWLLGSLLSGGCFAA